jgi:hypothetical protein
MTVTDLLNDSVDLYDRVRGYMPATGVLNPRPRRQRIFRRDAYRL